ncbi:MAG: DUF4440 domain-containing protein [Pyrinomonadaceae bacterium]
MKKTSIVILFTLLLTISALAQKDDSKNALGVVNQLFTEMAGHNPAGILALYTPESQLVALIKNKEGKSVTRVFTGEAFSQMFAVKRGEIKENMYAPEVKIFGDLALVWGRYVFTSDGKLSHCGVNSFHLVRDGESWKIANASSTIEPQGCTEAEKGMVKDEKTK